MFKIDSKTKQIDITRGDAAIFEIQALLTDEEIAIATNKGWNVL